MARDSGDLRGWAGWFKWLVGVVIALLAAGGGIVALLNYIEGQEQQKRQQYQIELEQWDNFSPSSISKGPQDTTIRGLDRIDLETGLVSSNPSPDRQWDLLFGCWPESYESLRALDGVSCFEKGVADFQAIRYREIRDAGYTVRRNATTGYNDLYYAHVSNVPGEGYIFYIRTPEGNVAKLQIIGYELVGNNPLVCRNMKIRYDVFPVVSDPPRPNPPN